MFSFSCKIALIFLCCLICGINAEEAPSLLIKIYVEDPKQLLPTLDKYTQNLSKQIPYQISVACNLDETELNAQDLKNGLMSYPHLSIHSSKDKTKIQALNSGVSELAGDFGILIVGSDKIEPAIPDYDKVIMEALQNNYKDHDGILNTLSDGRESINIAPAMTKAYYQRFGYIYNPSYYSSGHDQELTYVSRILNKETLLAKPVFKQVSQVNVEKMDENDLVTLQKRRMANFDVDDATLQKLFTKDWSILICTLDERAKQFSEIYSELQQQIKDNHLEDRVEVLFFRDNREVTVGFKRNALIKRSQGMYVNFIDDDDKIHEKYISMIHEKFKSKPDDVSLVGIITFNDHHPAKFIHSVKFKNYFQANGIYFRPPNHLNPMKRSTAAQFLFPSISYGEDTDWAMRIAKSGLLQKEEEITVPYYFYKYVDKK